MEYFAYLVLGVFAFALIVKFSKGLFKFVAVVAIALFILNSLVGISEGEGIIGTIQSFLTNKVNNLLDEATKGIFR